MSRKTHHTISLASIGHNLFCREISYLISCLVNDSQKCQIRVSCMERLRRLLPGLSMTSEALEEAIFNIIQSLPTSLRLFDGVGDHQFSGHLK